MSVILESLNFVIMTHIREVTCWVTAGRVKVDGDGAVFGCLRFYSSSEFLGSGMSHWDLFHIITKKGSAGCPQPQRATIPRRAKHLHNGSSVNQVSRQKFASDTSSRKVARENRNVKISHKEFHVCFLCFLFGLVVNTYIFNKRERQFWLPHTESINRSEEKISNIGTLA